MSWRQFGVVKGTQDYTDRYLTSGAAIEAAVRKFGFVEKVKPSKTHRRFLWERMKRSGYELKEFTN